MTGGSMESNQSEEIHIALVEDTTNLRLVRNWFVGR